MGYYITHVFWTCRDSAYTRDDCCKFEKGLWSKSDSILHCFSFGWTWTMCIFLHFFITISNEFNSNIFHLSLKMLYFYWRKRLSFFFSFLGENSLLVWSVVSTGFIFIRTSQMAWLHRCRFTPKPAWIQFSWSILQTAEKKKNDF